VPGGKGLTTAAIPEKWILSINLGLAPGTKPNNLPANFSILTIFTSGA